MTQRISDRSSHRSVICRTYADRPLHAIITKNLSGRFTLDNNTQTVSQDSKNLALIVWIGTLFFGFIPGLIVYLTKKDDAYAMDQAKEALNWSITAIIGYIAGTILSLILIGFLVLIAVGICQLAFCIMGAIAATSGKEFRVPFALRLIK